MSGCFCMGPQNGEPFCPCKMRQLNEWVKILEKSKITKLEYPTIFEKDFEVVKAAINEINSRKNK